MGNGEWGMEKGVGVGVESGGWWLVAGGWWVEAGGWRLVGGDRWVHGDWWLVCGAWWACGEARSHHTPPSPPHTHTVRGDPVVTNIAQPQSEEY